MRLTLTASQLPESRDYYSGAPAPIGQRTVMHLQAIQHFARGVIDAYAEQQSRFANYGLTAEAVEYASVALAWTEHLERRVKGRDESPPDCKRPEDVTRPEFWPDIVYDGEGPLAYFLGQWRWKHGDCKGKPRHLMPKELSAPMKPLESILARVPRFDGVVGAVIRKHKKEAT